jgi:Ala-tRNA(Pro) deacylase
MPIPDRLRNCLERNGVSYEVIDHPSAWTAQRVAEVTHIPGRDVAKAVIVRDGDTHHMIVLAADCVVDLDRLGEALGLRQPTLSTEEELSALFPDCEVGAMPIFGNLYNMPVAADDELAREPTIAFPAGNHRQCLRVDTQAFLQLVNPRIIQVAVHR